MAGRPRIPDHLMSEKQKLARTRYDRRIELGNTRQAKEGTRIRLPGEAHHPLYSFVVWVGGIPHQTEGVPFNRVLMQTRSLLIRLAREGMITSEEIESRMEVAREFVGGARDFEPRGDDESLVYPSDPRQVLVGFLSDDERVLVPTITKSEKPHHKSYAYRKEWLARKALASSTPAT